MISSTFLEQSCNAANPTCYMGCKKFCRAENWIPLEMSERNQLKLETDTVKNVTVEMERSKL